MTILSTGLSKIIQPKTSVEIVGPDGTPILDEIPLIITTLIRCPTLWASKTHPGSSVGGQRLRFNEDQINPFYIMLGGSALAWSVTGNGDYVLGSINSATAIDAAWDPKNKKWILVGWTNIIENSLDGKTFTSRSHPHINNPNGVRCGPDGTCCVVSDNMTKVEISSNGGDTWSFGPVLDGTPHTYRMVATDGAGTWLAAWDGGVYKSTDNAVSWSLSSAGFPNGTINREIVWAPNMGLWVAIIGQYIHTSPDGITWTQRFNAVTWNFLRIAYSDAGCLIAVGFSGNAVISTDGKTWTPISIGISGNIGGIAFSYDKVSASSDTELYAGTP